MKNPKFKVFDKRNNKFSNVACFVFLRGERDKGLYSLHHEDCDRFEFRMFTGLKDKNGNEIYEGDYVKFEYKVGDFTPKQMSQIKKKILNKEFICKVVWDEDCVCFNLIDGDSKTTHNVFPALCIKISTKI